MNGFKRQKGAFALVLMLALALAFVGCQGKSGSGGGDEPEATPPETGGITINWPFGNAPLTNAMVTNTAAVNELALTVYSSAGVKIPGAQGRVSATNLTTTLTVPVGTGYSVCALVMPVPGPLAVNVGSGCAKSVPVNPDTATLVSIFLSDNNSDITPSAAGTTAAPNYAYGEQPTITVAVNTITDDAYVASPGTYPYGSELNPGIPGDITSQGAVVYVVSDGYPTTSTVNQFVCNIPPAGTSCTVSTPGLGADFGVAYSTAAAVRFLALYNAGDYAMPSTDVNYSGMMTIWPVASPQAPTTVIGVLSSLASNVNPSPTGNLDINFR